MTPKVEASAGFRAPAALLSDAAASVAILFAASAPALLIALWASLNYVNLSAQHSLAQKAADAAALIGARQFALSNVTSATIDQAVNSAAEANLPQPGNLAAPDAIMSSIDTANNAVTVTVTRTLTPLMFGGFGFSTLTASATAVASFRSTPICVLILDPSAAAAFSAKAQSNLQAADCALQSNSASSTGLSGTTNGTIRTLKTCSAGGYAGAAFNPTPVTDCPAVADPLARRAPPPNVNAPCDHQSAVTIDSTNSGVALEPGVYCGGLTIKAAAIFDRGDYVIRGGSLAVIAGGSMNGVGVGFYLTGGAALDAQPNSGISLSAPSDPNDPMVGLVFWEDPNNMPASSPATHTIKSDNAQNLYGTVYFPQGTLVVGGSANVGSAAAYTIIVARDFQAFQQANIVLNANYSSSSIPRPQGVGDAAGATTLIQ